jgi:hypothetical protein
MKPVTPKPQRCAIYTRKSTEHNLDLEFNSLDAQREACEAYIKSQAHLSRNHEYLSVEEINEAPTTQITFDTCAQQQKLPQHDGGLQDELDLPRNSSVSRIPPARTRIFLNSSSETTKMIF